MKKELDLIYSAFLESRGVSTDSRTIKPGQIFFALSGDNFDGSKFVSQALNKGASLAVVSDQGFNNTGNVVCVENTLKTLQDLSRIHRLRFKIPVIALTGTNGKTTTKELINHLLSSEYNTLCTQGNFNNHIGVPLTLLNLNETHQIAVIEMGASGPGEIWDLCQIALPTHGLITSIGKAHLEGFGSVEIIIKTKTELYQYLKENGGDFFFNNAIKEILLVMKTGKFKNVYSFNNIEFRGNVISSVESDPSDLFINIKVKENNGAEHFFPTNIYGNYNFNNIVNSLKIADHFNIKIQNSISSLKAFVPSNNRSQLTKWKTNTLILDAYNANPTSVNEAVNSFEKLKDMRSKIIILGDMLELGITSQQEHLNVVSHLVNRNIYEFIILVGPEFKQTETQLKELPSNVRIFSNSEEVKQFFEQSVIEHSIILAKGSRGIRIESIFL